MYEQIKQDDACYQHWYDRKDWSDNEQKQTIAVFEQKCEASIEVLGCMQLSKLCDEGNVGGCAAACRAGKLELCCQAGDAKGCAQWQSQTAQKARHEAEWEAAREQERLEQRREAERERQRLLAVIADPETSSDAVVRLVTARDKSVSDAAAQRLLPVARDPATSQDWLEIFAGVENEALRLAVIANTSTPPLAHLLLCPAGGAVRVAVRRNPKAREICDYFEGCVQFCQSSAASAHGKQMSDDQACSAYMRMGGTCSSPAGPAGKALWNSPRGCEGGCYEMWRKEYTSRRAK